MCPRGASRKSTDMEKQMKRKNNMLASLDTLGITFSSQLLYDTLDPRVIGRTYSHQGVRFTVGKDGTLLPEPFEVGYFTESEIACDQE